MSLEDVVLLVAASVAATVLLSRFRPRLAAEVRRPWLWLGMLMLGLGASIVSGLIVREGASGTGTRRQWGWPKPFWTHWQSWEDGSVSTGLSAVQLAANLGFYAAIALLTFIFVRHWR